MLNSEILSFIRDEIKRQVNVILNGQSGDNTQFIENIENMLPGMSTIVNRPVMHPYGLVSRAPRGTFQVTGRVGDHFGNRMVLGHRDQQRPALEQGETILYNQYGQAIYLANGAVHLGSKEATNPAPLGNELKDLLGQFITLMAAHTHVGNLGSPTTAPINSTSISSLKSNFVDNDEIVSQLIFLLKEAG